MDKSIRKQLDSIYKDKKNLDNYSFTLFYFIKCLYDTCTKSSITDIFFFSREGQFLKRLFDSYVNALGEEIRIQTHYLYVSRKSVCLACANPIEKETFFPMRGYRNISIDQFLKGLSFTEDEISAISNTLSFDSTDIQNDFFDSVSFQELKANGQFQSIYESKRTLSRNAILTYLQNVGFLDASKVAVVDIGWAGTVQYYLSNLLPDKQIEGYYLGISWRGNDSRYLDHKHALVFDNRNGKDVFLIDYFLYEIICVADHGATVGYTTGGEPILSDDSDCEIYQNVFGDIQSHITDKFMRIFQAVRNMDDMPHLRKYISMKYCSMLLTLSREERNILAYARSKHEDNFISQKKFISLKYWLAQLKKKMLLILGYLKLKFA